jgi:hypothetical protein
MTYFTEPNDLSNYEKALMKQIYIQQLVEAKLSNEFIKNPNLDIPLFIHEETCRIEQLFTSEPTLIPINPYWLARIRGK